MHFPSVDAHGVGWLSVEQMREVDRIMVDDLHIELLQMMENAGRNLARLVLELFDPATVIIHAGPGGNGGGGLVAARHLANAGVDVGIVTSRPVEDLTPVPLHQADILQRMGVPFLDTPRRADVAVDALIGYSLRGAPSGRTADLIAGLADTGDSIVSLDTPSGLDVTTGRAPGAVVTARATLTLALPKRGLRAAPQTGDLYLADISVPPAVYQRFGATPPPDFRGGSILRILR